MIETKFYCRYCGATFNEPERVMVPDDPFAVNTVFETCPRCGSEQTEEMEPCPTCDGGWKTHDEQVCQKCHLRNVNDIRLFVRQYRAETLDDMDKIIEGESLRNFQ